MKAKIPELICSTFPNKDPDNREVGSHLKSAVALILHVKEGATLEEVEILLLQRADNPKDVYSGEICLPGGKQEAGETLLQTAVRETEEETAIKLTDNNFLRPVNYQFYARTGYDRIRKQYTPFYTYAFIFTVNQQQKQLIKINLEEMQLYRWVPLHTFLDPVNFTLWSNKVVNRSLVLIMEQRHSPKEMEQFQKYFKELLYPAINVGFQTPLYGLTMFMTTVVLTMISKHLQTMGKEQSMGNQSQIDLLRVRLLKLQAHLKQMKLNFSENFEKKQEVTRAIMKNYMNMRSISHKL